MTDAPRSRNGLLLGALFVVLTAAGFLVGGDTPDVKATAIKIKAEYDNNEGQHLIATYLVSLGSVALVFFGAHLRGALRAMAPASRMANAAFGGAAVTAAGFLFAASVHGALTEAANHDIVAPAALQALNALDNWDFPAFVGGMSVLILASGIAIARAPGGLPSWFGWLGVVIGVVAISPVGFFGFLAGGLWLLVLSLWLYGSWDDLHGAAAPPTATVPG